MLDKVLKSYTKRELGLFKTFNKVGIVFGIVSVILWTIWCNVWLIIISGGAGLCNTMIVILIDEHLKRR